MKIVDFGAVDKLCGERDDLVRAAFGLFLLLARLGFMRKREIIEGERLRRVANSFLL